MKAKGDIKDDSDFDDGVGNEEIDSPIKLKKEPE
jgi:hypothetical protein